MDRYGHTLYRRRRYLDDPDCRVTELVAETEDKGVQGGFGSGVSGKGGSGDNGEVGARAISFIRSSCSFAGRRHVLYQACLRLLAHEHG